MKPIMMIISLAVHHVVLVCAAAFELRVRLVVTDLVRCPPHPLRSRGIPQSLPQSLHPVQRPSSWISVSVVLVSVGCCDRGADLQLACLLVDDLIKSVWRPLSKYFSPILPLCSVVSGILLHRLRFSFLFDFDWFVCAQWKSWLVNWL